MTATASFPNRATAKNTVTLMLARPAWWAAASAMCLVVLLVLFNVFAHRVAVIDTAEVDGYFVRADELLRGEPYSDPYRPPLYVLLTAGLSLLLGRNTFVAASLISSIATGLLVGLTYLLAGLFVRPKYALLTQFLVMVSPVVALYGLMGSTDALFALLSLATLLLAVMRRHMRVLTGMRGAAALGILFGLAYLTRYTSVFLLPVVVYGLWQDNATWRLQLRLISIAFVGAALVTLPWLAYNTMINGSPFANENWRNLAFALYGEGNWQYLKSADFAAGYVEIISRDLVGVLHLWGKNAIVMPLVIPLFHSSSLALAIFLPIGLASLIRNQEGGRLLLVYVVACTTLIIIAFRYIPRLLLPATSVLILTGVIGLARVLSKLSLRFVRAAILALVILLPIRQLSSLVHLIFQNQPLAEVQMLDHLADETSATSENPVRVVSTYQYLAYFAKSPERIRHHWVPHYSKQFPQLLLDTASLYNAEFVLISDRTTGGAVRAGLADAALPRCWTLQWGEMNASGTIRLYKNNCGAANNSVMLSDHGS